MAGAGLQSSLDWSAIFLEIGFAGRNPRLVFNKWRQKRNVLGKQHGFNETHFEGIRPGNNLFSFHGWSFKFVHVGYMVIEVLFICFGFEQNTSLSGFIDKPLCHVCDDHWSAVSASATGNTCQCLTVSLDFERGWYLDEYSNSVWYLRTNFPNFVVTCCFVQRALSPSLK